MYGNSIGGCEQIGVNTIGSHSSGVVHCNTAFYADSTLYYKGYDNQYHQVAGLYDWYAGGESDYIDIIDATGAKLRITFSHGLYKGYKKI